MEKIIILWKNNYPIEITTDLKSSKCSKCNKVIYWGKTEKWKNIPLSKINNDWITHFEDCSFANDFKK